MNSSSYWSKTSNAKSIPSRFSGWLHTTGFTSITYTCENIKTPNHAYQWKTLNAYRKQREDGVSLAFDVGEELSISSQKNRYSPYNLYNENTTHKINKHSNNHTNTLRKHTKLQTQVIRVQCQLLGHGLVKFCLKDLCYDGSIRMFSHETLGLDQVEFDVI